MKFQSFQLSQSRDGKRIASEILNLLPSKADGGDIAAIHYGGRHQNKLCNVGNSAAIQ